MLKRSTLAALVLALASGTFAQAQSSQTSQSSQSSGDFGARPSGSVGSVYSNAIQSTLLRQSMNDDAHSDVSLEQRRRAQRAVTLIRANRCEDAYNMALAEQDNRLALNIAVACKAHVRQ